mmetsp:Transcript_5932/g.8128  ORF Transcript_5932/g.8128 Transcript_5932/m.8128 type:complete len:91 (+) Transcript_5932:61-333(+)
MEVEEINKTFFPYCCVVEINFPSNEAAQITRNSLEVDEELQPKKVSKKFEVLDSTLKISFEATEVKMLRVAVSSFFDMAAVVLRTLQEFS